jgi:hypothetical protein
MGQVVEHPLRDPDLADRIVRPDYSDPARYAQCEGALEQAEADRRYVMAGIFMVLFERMHCVYGFENTLVGLYHERKAMETLADTVVETHLTLVREIGRRFPGRVHGFTMTDDWGTQQAAFISSDLWMDFFLPRYKRLFDAMHEIGCDVWVHSCGKVNEIVEGYIQAGVDVVNLQQPRALGIEEIGRRYRGRIAFESLADIQSTLPGGRDEDIASDAAALMTSWATPAGGFILGDYGDEAAIGVTKPGVKRLMYERFSAWSERVYGEPLPRLP